MNSRNFKFLIPNSKSIFAGALIILLLITTALIAPLISPYDPSEQNLFEGLKEPGSKHILGQDRLGRDILSRIIYGSRVSLQVGIMAVGISLIIGLIIGSASGYFGGFIDNLFMRIADILLAFPGILLAIGITAVLGPSLTNVILALSIISWVGYARLIRGQILSAREYEYVSAARAIGAGDFRIITKHILPNIIAPVLVQASFGMAGAITAEAGLSFLGLGTQPPTPSWGSMLNEGRNYLLVAPHLTIFPGIAIMIVVIAFNFLGDSLRDMWDVKER